MVLAGAAEECARFLLNHCDSLDNYREWSITMVQQVQPYYDKRK